MKKNIISAILLAALSLVLVFALCAPAFASDSQPSDQASEPAVLSAPTETAEDKTVSTKAVLLLQSAVSSPQQALRQWRFRSQKALRVWHVSPKRQVKSTPQ